MKKHTLAILALYTNGTSVTYDGLRDNTTITILILVVPNLWPTLGNSRTTLLRMLKRGVDLLPPYRSVGGVYLPFLALLRVTTITHCTRTTRALPHQNNTRL